jgi:hypothetical protein
MTEYRIHLGFDMGIKNLAYCLIKHNISGDIEILRWDNINLLEDGKSSQDANKCTACKSPATWLSNTDMLRWCKACAFQTRVKKGVILKPVLKPLPCAITVKPLKELAINSKLLDIPAPNAKKQEYIEWAKLHYLFPWKPVKASSVSLGDIRRAIDKWLDGEMLASFSTASLIRLENQPVMKGPTMKSVQMILFTLLGHRLEYEFGWSGAIEFVHAGTKTKHIEGDTEEKTDAEAYKNRKMTAEIETANILTKLGADEWLNFFKSRKKKSDLADAFLMALRP